MGNETARLRRLLPALAMAAAGLTATACTPIAFAPVPSGVVVDAATGAPVSGAIVVFRYDRRSGADADDVDALAHREVLTGADGRFRAPGLAWRVAPSVRIASVLAAGYRCGSADGDAGGSQKIALARAGAVEERRASCVPVSGTPREVPHYRAAWQALYPSVYRRSVRQPDAEVERVLAARRLLGFGANCEGPVTDLALSRDGRRLATWRQRAGSRATIRIQDLSGTEPVLLDEVDAPLDAPGVELAWTARHELVSWQPYSTHPPEVVPTLGLEAPRSARVLWQPEAPPAAPALAPARAGEPPRSQPLGRDDLLDPEDARWGERSFHRRSVLDPRTGLPVDVLETWHADGGRHAIALPGEACGRRFGQPEQRITSDGDRAVDLRYVSGGCRPVRIDLDTGRYHTLDEAVGARCRETRPVLAARFEDALRGYSLEVRRALSEAGADPASAFVLRLGRDGEARVEARDPFGRLVDADLPRFPLRTPLREIRVSVVGSAPAFGRSVPGIQPL